MFLLFVQRKGGEERFLKFKVWVSVLLSCKLMEGNVYAFVTPCRALVESHEFKCTTIMGSKQM